jgi:hypothetical protein
MGSDHSKRELLIQEIRDKRRPQQEDLESATLLGGFESIDLNQPGGEGCVQPSLDKVKLETILFTARSLSNIKYKTHTLRTEIQDLNQLLQFKEKHQEYKDKLDDLRRGLEHEIRVGQDPLVRFCGFLTKAPDHTRELREVLHQLPDYRPNSL